jgi:hypothetical protein
LEIETVLNRLTEQAEQAVTRRSSAVKRGSGTSGLDNSTIDA